MVNIPKEAIAVLLLIAGVVTGGYYYQDEYYTPEGDLITDNVTLIANVSYGDGWTHYDYVDGSQAHKLAPTNYLRWDDEWRPKYEMNFSSGDWPYLVEQNETHYIITRLDDVLPLKKLYREYDFQPYKIGVRLTLTPVQLNGLSTPAGDYWYISIPQSLKETSKHLNWDNKLPIISNENGFILNQSENVLGEWLPNYKYQNVGGELRLYYNQIARDFGISITEITFDFNSYVINGSTSPAWQNTSYDNNITEVQATGNIELQILIDDYTSYWRFDDNTTVDENSSNVNELDRTGGVTYTTDGKYGGAYVFDDGFLQQSGAFDSRFDVTESTWTLWINNTDNSGDVDGGQVLVYDSLDMYFQVRSWHLQVYLYDLATPGYHNHDILVVENETTFVAISYNSSAASNALKLYVGGTPQTFDINGTTSFNMNPTHGCNDGGARIFRGMLDDIRFYNYVLTDEEINQTRDNEHKTIGNVTHWHDAGSGYQTASFIVNMTTPTNTNYTVWYADNGSSFTQIGGTYTGNQTPSITGTKYQNTDLRIVMNGNTTATPEEMEVTFVTETSAAAPNITSWANNKTSNNTFNITINTSEEVNFNATANQTITTWNWYKDDVDQGWNYDNITLNWSSTGLKHVVVNATNANGTSGSIALNVTVESVGEPDTKFQYWTGSAWTETNVNADALWFDCWWGETACANAEQSSGQATLNVTNNGTATGVVYMWLNTSPPSGIRIFVDDDSTYPTDSIELSTSSTQVNASLAVDDSVLLWSWANFSYPADDYDFIVYAAVNST